MTRRRAFWTLVLFPALCLGLVFSLSPALPEGFCVKSDQFPSAAMRISITGQTIVFCLGDDPCMSLDTARGIYTAAKVPEASGDERATDYGRTLVTIKDKSLQVCREKRCSTLTPDVMPTAAWAVSLSGSLRYVAVNYQLTVKESAVYMTDIYDFNSRKRIARHRFSKSDECASALFLGDTLMVTRSNCAGPSDTSEFAVPETGKKIASLGNGMSTSGVNPVQINGDVWAFQNFEGDRLVIQDVRTGRILQNIVLSGHLPKKPDGTPMLEPGSTVLAGGAGKLFVIYSGALPGVVIMLDQTGRVLKTFRPSTCAVK